MDKCSLFFPNFDVIESCMQFHQFINLSLLLAKYPEIASCCLTFPLVSAAARMSIANRTSSTSMSLSKSGFRCTRAKLCNGALATIMRRIFTKVLRSAKCGHKKRCFSNLQHLSITHLVHLYALLQRTSPAFFDLRIVFVKYALHVQPLSQTRMPSIAPSLNLSAFLLFSKLRGS